VSFLDITGYTRLTEERGDEAAAELAAKRATLVRGSSRDHGGQPVKWLGDGVMFYFPSPGEGVLAALDMVEGVASHVLPPAGSGSTPGRSSSRRVTTLAGPSTSRRGSPSTPDPARCW